jgi:hypothetical protein
MAFDLGLLLCRELTSGPQSAQGLHQDARLRWSSGLSLARSAPIPPARKEIFTLLVGW